MDWLGEMYDKTHSSRRCARALSAARLLGDQETHTFFTDFARDVDATTSLDHVIRFLHEWEFFVLNGFRGGLVKEYAERYQSPYTAELMVRPVLWTADAYLRASHPGGHDEVLGGETDDLLCIRMSRFGVYFGIETLLDEWVNYKPADIHDGARLTLEAFELSGSFAQDMKKFYASSWYRTQQDTRLQPDAIAAFVKRHMPAVAGKYL